VIAYCARVSSPNNQHNENTAGLLKYCMKHGHWSIYEMASMCVEVTTTRAISPQILRHRSFSFQEFSMRYAETTAIHKTEVRRQDTTNRQNSIDDVEDSVQTWWAVAQQDHNKKAAALYSKALEAGIAKECARMVLPLSSETKLYMSGTIRSYIHYCQLRCGAATQKEHREIAQMVLDVLRTTAPLTMEVFFPKELS